MAGDRSGFAGRRFSLAAGAGLRYEPLRRSLPLLIGTWGERTAAFAAEAADELKLGGSANPELARLFRRRLGDAVAIVLGSVTVVDDDGEAARAKAREEVALYFPVVARLDATLDVPPGLPEEMGRLVGAGDARAAGALLPDALLRRFAFAGTPEEVAEHAAACLDAGAARVDFGTPHGLTHERGVELLATRVAPLLR